MSRQAKSHQRRPWQRTPEASLLRQEPHRVDRLAVDAGLEMAVVAGGVTCRADVADHLAARDVLAVTHAKATLVRVPRAQPAAVVDDDDVAVAAHGPGVDHGPCLRG